MSPHSGLSSPRHHAVSFYDDDAEVVAAVGRYIGHGLAEGEHVIVVATAAHRSALDEALRALGHDPSLARATGRYVAVDAAETLATFMVDGSPDQDRFVSTVGGLVDAAAADGSRVRAFGEMVALLWDEGNVAGAIALEGLWNGLGEHREFSLFCAYPTTVLDAAALGDVGRVCDLHSAVLPPASYDITPAGDAPWSRDGGHGGVQRSEVFVPAPEAVGAVRRFVTSALEEWHQGQLVADAALVASEMASNAIVHARSPFRAFIHRDADVVLIAIKDVGAGAAERQPATTDSLSGRGVAIVEALSDHWGCDELPDGKLVWAEFTTALADQASPAD